MDALDNNNPHRFWKDKEAKLKKEAFKFVPKGFYTNYKTNMLREAGNIAATLVTLKKSESDDELFSDCEHPDIENCDCDGHV